MILFVLACFPEFQSRNFAPELEITAPADGSLYNEGELIQVEAIVTDEGLMDGTISLQWQSDLDGLLHELLPNQDGTASLSSHRLSPGEHNTLIIA